MENTNIENSFAFYVLFKAMNDKTGPESFVPPTIVFREFKNPINYTRSEKHALPNQNSLKPLHLIEKKGNVLRLNLGHEEIVIMPSGKTQINASNMLKKY